MDAVLADAIKAALGNYPQVRQAYYEDVFAAVFDYLDSDGAVTSFRNAMKRAMVNAFSPTADIAWEDAGAILPVDEETSAWVTAMIDGELGYIDTLFQTLKQTRKGEDVQKAAIAQARAEGYAATLDRVYNYVKVAAAGNTMLTFTGDDGKESCTDCSKYKGKRHKASWWISHNAVPPNRDFECGGYNCQHTLIDDRGKVWTL